MRKNPTSERRAYRIVPIRGWRFVRTNRGDQFCVEQLLFKSGKLKEVDCYRFDEFGTRFDFHLRPREIADMSEIAEFLNLEQN